jgi:branched-chain amino acid transport system permease protein
VTTIWTGLSVGAVYGIVALGYNIVFLACGALNFANASLLMVGIFVTYWARVTEHLSFGVAILVAAAVAMVVAVAQERLTIRPVKSLDGMVVTTVGAAIVMAGVVQVIWGSNPLSFKFVGRTSPLRVLGGSVLIDELALIAAALMLTGLTSYALRRTMVGLALLAGAENQEAMTLRGIDARRLRLAAFAISGVLAGAAACLVGPQTLAYPDLGSTLALKGFVALAIGGFGSVAGGLAGGFAVGLIEAEVAGYMNSAYSDIFVLVALLAVLLARPSGLFVRARERTV